MPGGRRVVGGPGQSPGPLIRQGDRRTLRGQSPERRGGTRRTTAGCDRGGLLDRDRELRVGLLGGEGAVGRVLDRFVDDGGQLGVRLTSGG
jgi:hypothetical protein